MYTNRRKFVAKRGQALTLIELFKSSSIPPLRIYGPNGLATGTFDTVIVEAEHESLADYERSVSEFFATPEAATFQEKLNELTETGGSNQLLKQF